MASKSKEVFWKPDSNSAVADTNTDPITQGFTDFSKKLVCIVYPGKVKNVNRMFETLGGIEAIEHIVAHPKRNMELRFRPDDLYSKPCISERSTKPNILLKIKVRKPLIKESTEDSHSSCKPEIVSFEVLGLSAITFNFNKMCDFQYLPLSTKSSVETSESTLEYIHDNIIPKKLPDLNWFEDEQTQNLPLFLPPAFFSKSDVTSGSLHFDRSHFYEGRFRAGFAERFRNQEVKRKVAQSKQDTSKMRNVFLCRYDDDIPIEPNKTMLNNFQSKINFINGLNEALTKIKKYFEDRPIASRNCLQYHLQFNAEHFKILLPCVAFYYINGPWRLMWVRYGFDPRKDSRARIYQSLDFRIRSVVGLKRFINSKNKYMKKTDTSYDTTEPQPSTSTQSLLHTINDPPSHKTQPDKYTLTEDTFMLRPGLLPSARQLMYQYCDVQLPDIQAMLSRLPNIAPGTKSDPKNGWLPPGFNGQCREIVTKYIDAEINRIAERQRANAATTVPKIMAGVTDDGEERRAAGGDKNGAVLHEISSDDSSSSSSSEDVSDDDERGNGTVGVDEDLLEEIGKLIDSKVVN